MQTHPHMNMQTQVHTNSHTNITHNQHIHTRADTHSHNHTHTHPPTHPPTHTHTHTHTHTTACHDTTTAQHILPSNTGSVVCNRARNDYPCPNNNQINHHSMRIAPASSQQHRLSGALGKEGWVVARFLQHRQSCKRGVCLVQGTPYLRRVKGAHRLEAIQFMKLTRHHQYRQSY